MPQSSCSSADTARACVCPARITLDDLHARGCVVAGSCPVASVELEEAAGDVVVMPVRREQGQDVEAAAGAQAEQPHPTCRRAVEASRDLPAHLL